MEKQFREDK